MTSFDFNSEMIYGKKHLNNLVFDKEKYNFVSVVSKLFDCDLTDIHNWTNVKYDLFGSDMLGKDTHTVFHKAFYNKLDSEMGWPELTELYEPDDSILSGAVSVPFIQLRPISG